MSVSKNSQVFYIHGFGSSAKSDTLKLLQKSFPDVIGLTYDHTEPAASIKSLVTKLRGYADKDLIIVGSSLGGWYTEQLTRKIVAQFIMYNPATQPEVTLAKYGVDQEVLFKYKIMGIDKLEPASRTVVISIDDEVIHPAIADIKYKNIADMIYTAGGHRITQEAMDHIVKKIKFLENQLP